MLHRRRSWTWLPILSGEGKGEINKGGEGTIAEAMEGEYGIGPKGCARSAP